MKYSPTVRIRHPPLITSRFRGFNLYSLVLPLTFIFITSFSISFSSSCQIWVDFFFFFSFFTPRVFQVWLFHSYWGPNFDASFPPISLHFIITFFKDRLLDSFWMYCIFMSLFPLYQNVNLTEIPRTGMAPHTLSPILLTIVRMLAFTALWLFCNFLVLPLPHTLSRAHHPHFHVELGIWAATPSSSRWRYSGLCVFYFMAASVGVPEENRYNSSRSRERLIHWNGVQLGSVKIFSNCLSFKACCYYNMSLFFFSSGDQVVWSFVVGVVMTAECGTGDPDVGSSSMPTIWTLASKQQRGLLRNKMEGCWRYEGRIPGQERRVIIMVLWSLLWGHKSIF